MKIDYDYKINSHTDFAGREMMKFIIEECSPKSLLDVGCGPGTWLRAASEFGIADLMGIDGTDSFLKENPTNKDLFKQVDLTHALSLGRKFDAVICLEVAEHLPEESAENLIKILTDHGDIIYFSAACPNQPGQNHINCKWPSFWQQLFNERGYECEDRIRWQFWDNQKIEPWYRQNIFVARKSLASANLEPRLLSILHPEMVAIRFSNEKDALLSKISALESEHVIMITLNSHLNNEIVRLSNQLNDTIETVGAYKNLIFTKEVEIEKSSEEIRYLKHCLKENRSQIKLLQSYIKKINRFWLWRFVVSRFWRHSPPS
jgi:SAM-dependent methyltransferase